MVVLYNHRSATLTTCALQLTKNGMWFYLILPPCYTGSPAYIRSSGRWSICSIYWPILKRRTEIRWPKKNICQLNRKLTVPAATASWRYISNLIFQVFFVRIVILHFVWLIISRTLLSMRGGFRKEDNGCGTSNGGGRHWRSFLFYPTRPGS